jgi:ribosomal protein S18 acetylase RimI-like enzyme
MKRCNTTMHTQADITFKAKLPDKHQFVRLYETTGWNASYQLSVDELFQAISCSWYLVAAYDRDALVGSGRLVSDGITHALILDLIVLPEYQGQGIGSIILRHLIAHCEAHQMRDIQLFSAKGKAGFYKKFGFEERPLDAPGMQIRRKI